MTPLPPRKSESGPRTTMGESHRARAIRFTAFAGCSEGQAAIVHALLAVEEQVRNLAFYLSNGGDTRRLDADDPTHLADPALEGDRA